MKKFAVALALCASSSVFAQDLMIGDLNFFQKAGSVRWNTELDYSSAEFENKDEKSEYKNSAINFNNTVTYGISDKFNVGLGLNYGIKNDLTNDKVATGAKNKKAERDGLSDISILGNYRLMDNNLFVDLVGGVTLGLTDAEMARGDQNGKTEGNMNQGHHSIALGVAAGQKVDANWEWRAFLGLDYHLSGETEMVQKVGKNGEFDTDAYMNWKASVDGQYRMDNKWAFAAGLDYVLSGEQTFEGTGASKGTEYDIDRDGFFRVRLAAKHNLSSNMLVTLGWDMTMGHDVDYKVKGGSDFTEEHDLSHRFVLGGQFLF